MPHANVRGTDRTGVRSVTDNDQVVVKVSQNRGFQHEVSMYLDEYGRVDCRYFPRPGLDSVHIFSGILDKDGFEVTHVESPYA